MHNPRVRGITSHLCPPSPWPTSIHARPCPALRRGWTLLLASSARLRLPTRPTARFTCLAADTASTVTRTSPLRWVFEYNPGADTWTQKNALLDGVETRERYVANMAAATLTDTNGPRIYVIGGTSIDSVPTPAVRVYDPNADAISVLPSADEWPANPQHSPGGWAVYDNKLYIFGGFSALGGGPVFADTWRFDPMAASGSKWTQLDLLNVARGYIAGAELDGKIYAVGGDTWDAGTGSLVPSNVVEMLDPSQPNPTWVTVASLPIARGDLQAWAYDTGTNHEISAGS